MSDYHTCMAGPLFYTILWLAILVNSGRAVDANTLPIESEECSIAQSKCAFRPSCLASLHSYMIDCADVLAGRSKKCPHACKKALISLTSTEPGLVLANCHCGDNEYCLQSKERMEVCRPEVTYATADDTVVSCSVAHWICAADPLCRTALEYYHLYCRVMFHGRKCTPRCNNSLSILNRQEKASKLRNCYCEGSEDFPCFRVKQNTQRLCFGQEWINNEIYLPTEETLPSSSSGTSPNTVFFCFLVFAILMFFNKTIGEDFGCVNIKDVTKSDPQIPVLVGSQETQRVSSPENKMWPWWWTSEKSAA